MFKACKVNGSVTLTEEKSTIYMYVHGHVYRFIGLQMNRTVREQNSGLARLSELGSVYFLKRADLKYKNLFS